MGPDRGAAGARRRADRRLRDGIVAGAVAAALTAAVAGNLSGFSETAKLAAYGGESVHPWNVLWPLTGRGPRDLDRRRAARRDREGDPGLARAAAHPLIVALALPLSAAWWFSRRRTPDDVLGLLALLFLVRCLLDPVDNAYYHVPFLLSLMAWEGLARRGLPLVSILSSVTIYYAIYKAGWPRSRAPQRLLPGGHPAGGGVAGGQALRAAPRRAPERRPAAAGHPPARSPRAAGPSR